MDEFIFSKIIHEGKIYQNYVGIVCETSKGKHVLLPSFNGNLTHTPKCRFGTRKCRGCARLDPSV